MQQMTKLNYNEVWSGEEPIPLRRGKRERYRELGPGTRGLKLRVPG